MELVSVRTETDYTNLLRQLLPPGPAWEGEEIQDLIAKLAKEMARTDQRIYALFSEMDPNTVTELVPEWEKVMNLPDPCLGEAPSFSDRVQQVRERLAAVFYMGNFLAEALMLAETGHATGAIQIAGSASASQLPFFVAACDYTLLGEELYAASAYLSQDPLQIGSLKGQDAAKALIMGLIILGVAAVSLGYHF